MTLLVSIGCLRRACRLLSATAMLSFPAFFLANAQTAPQPPYALLQNATITGSGNTITAVHVPVVISGGVTIYLDLTMQFSVDSNGNLTLSAGYPQLLPSPALLTASFKAGNYVGPSTLYSGKALVTVNGPGVTDGGATLWSLSATTGANVCTYPASANWYAGPIASNSLASRLSKIGLSSTSWSYGTIGFAAGCGGTSNWLTNALIGVSQVGNTITFVSFTDGFGIDHNTPVDQITYTLTQ